jgi:hypothetical protein
VGQERWVRRGDAQQASVHRCRVVTAACARARPASRGPYPQTLLSAVTTIGGQPRVSWGVPRRGRDPAPPLSPALHPVLPSLFCPLAQGRLEGNGLKLNLLTSDSDLQATPPRGPRIRPGGREILERGQRGVGDVLLQLGGITLSPGISPKSKSLPEGVARQSEVKNRDQKWLFLLFCPEPRLYLCGSQFSPIYLLSGAD